VLAWAQRVGDYQYMAAGEREVGEAALERGEFEEALERATRSRDLGAGRGHTLMVFLAETLRCRAAVRLGRNEEAIEAMVATMDLFAQGDLEADEELDEAVVSTAVELFAGIGEVQLARRLEPVGRRLAAVRAWVLPDVQQTHDAWLAANGVRVTSEGPTLEVAAALATVRQWLADRRTA
jgi:hypothetical protein